MIVSPRSVEAIERPELRRIFAQPLDQHFEEVGQPSMNLRMGSSSPADFALIQRMVLLVVAEPAVAVPADGRMSSPKAWPAR